MSWLSRNAESIEALAASVTALAAVAALIGVSIQLNAADEISRAQSAREAYAAHLALAVANPKLSEPEDVCALLQSDQAASYEAFVDHMLYSAEQMLTSEAGWDATFYVSLGRHAEYLCMAVAPGAETEELGQMLVEFRKNTCEEVVACDVAE